MSALANANINVGGREIRIGQQSVNIRGVGLMDDGGNNDLTKGYNIGDIEKSCFANRTACPILVKDWPTSPSALLPRLGIWGTIMKPTALRESW